MRLPHFILLPIALLAIIFKISAQQKKIDSLENRLKYINQQTHSYSTDTQKINTLTALARQMGNYNINTGKALDYANEAFILSDKIKFNKGKVESLFQAGKLYEFQGQYDQAVAKYTKALNISKELNEKLWIASALYFIGNVYGEQGNYPAALDHYLQSLRINEETSNDLYIARDLTYIGNIYSEIEDNQTALQYYLQALKKYRMLDNKFWIAINLQNLANTHKKENDYIKALEYYNEVLKMQKGNLHSMYLTYIDIADVYRSQYNSYPEAKPDSAWEKSMEYYSSAIKIAEELDDQSTIGTALNGTGWLYLEKNYLSKAELALKKSLQLLEITGSPEILKDCYYNLSRLDSIKGNYKSALQNFKSYSLINDSLFNRKKSRQLAQLQIKYETDKKQEEITVLNKDNQLKNLKIEKQQKNILLIIAVSLIVLLATGGFLYYRNRKIRQETLKQISEAKLASLKSLMDKHFIFSSLHSIDTFLMNNDTEAASDYLVKYSKLIRSILEMSNQPEVSLEEEIVLCRSYLDLEKIRLNNSFEYEFTIDGTIHLQQTLFPSMLLQPLVENAVKHGIGSLRNENTGRKGSIKVEVYREKDKLICTVTDNGKGLQFSGTSSKNHRSYSGKGIIERVKVYNNLRKNKASFLLKDNNPGVTAVLTLPYLSKKQSIAV